MADTRPAASIQPVDHVVPGKAVVHFRGWLPSVLPSRISTDLPGIEVPVRAQVPRAEGLAGQARQAALGRRRLLCSP